MIRSLATIQKVRAISPIPESDFLELAHIMGWQCVVKKGEFKEGDLGVYFEVDSFLPEEPRYEFLRASSFRDNADNGRGFRIRTVKLRGQLSQGLILPIASFPELADFNEEIEAFYNKSEPKVPEDKSFMESSGCRKAPTCIDVTEKLGVKKWYIPETSTPGGTITGDRPSGVPTSDEIRLQSALELLDELKGKPYYITTKMDGTSGTVFYIDGKVGCCSRNKEIKDEESALYWMPVYKYGLKEKLTEQASAGTIPKNLVLIGEICGPGIQKNKLRLPEMEWYVFDVLDKDTGYVPYDKMIEICAVLGLPTVPLEERGEQFDYTLEMLLEKAKGKYPSGLDKEGIVVRDAMKPKSVSFKVLNNDALLKEKD